MLASNIGPGLLISCAGEESKAYVAIRILIYILPFPHLTDTGYLPFAQGEDNGHSVGISDGSSLRPAALTSPLGGPVFMCSKIIPIDYVRRDSSGT